MKDIILFIVESIYSDRDVHNVPKTIENCTGGVMVSMLVSRVVDSMFETRSDQTKCYKIGMCCFSTKDAALRRKSRDWLARNHDNVSEWGNMSTCN